MASNALGQDYVKLALHLNKHIDGLVDAYFGPKALIDEVANEGTLPLATLDQRCAELRGRAASEVAGVERRTFLVKQLEALAAQIEAKTGQPFPKQGDFRQYVQRLFDIDPTPADEAELEAHRQQIAAALAALGYVGDLADAVARWEQDRYVSGPALLDLINHVLEEARKRTKQIVELPPSEDVRVEAVQNQPWSGYNWYQGDFKSLIQVNIDIPRTRIETEDLVTHETYPGHHTDHATKEMVLYRGRGFLEESIMLINTPSAVLSEGIASTAGTFIASEEPDADQQIATLLRKLRRGCDVNATLMLHDQGLGTDACREYLETKGLMTWQRAEKRLSFLTHPLWQPYSYTYWAGGRLVEEYYARAKRAGKLKEAFEVLYRHQLTPSGLRERMGAL